MKKIIYVLIGAAIFGSCVGNANQTKTTSSCGCGSECSQSATTNYRIDSLLSRAETLVDKEVVVVGVVTHTCKYSGRRCFMMADDQKTSFRIEAKGDIGGFNRELIGSELAVTGVLRENRLTTEYLNDWEEKVKERQGKEDGSAESCAAETNNIAQMREWMKKHNKEYYSLYYMDGQSYKVVE